MNAALLGRALAPAELPATTMLGALCRYITHAAGRSFQPMKANLGLLEPLAPQPKGRPQRGLAYALRSSQALHSYMDSLARPCA
jgi:methylenetetrahydrofolate--tRNA-(uracil-5-)-methyltransferase